MSTRKILLACVFGLSLATTAANAAQYVVVEARGVNLKVGAIVDPTKAAPKRRPP